jgi:hypothetical protein
MATATISIQVDEKAAQAFATATTEEQRKIELLLNLRLQDLTTGARRPLKAVMDQIGTPAEAAGLTSEILESLLQQGESGAYSI